MFPFPRSGGKIGGGKGYAEKLDLYLYLNDKKKKLAKRLMDITDKLEDISNQIYHLQQRLEVIERKMDIGRY